MDTLLPAATAVDAAAAFASLLVYICVALAAMVAAPRDLRARLFLVIALASVAPYSLTIASWRGLPLASTPMWFWAAIVGSVAVGTVALFHFTQVFPWRRPWIAAHGPWLVASYAATALVGVGLIVAAPGDLLNPPVAYVAAVLVLGIPWTFLVLIVLPFCGLFSLFKSRQDAARPGADGARTTTTLMLISQLAGGILAVIVIPLLRAAAPDGTLVTAGTLLLTAFALLMPVAFALGVWKYRILSLTDSEA